MPPKRKPTTTDDDEPVKKQKTTPTDEDSAPNISDGKKKSTPTTTTTTTTNGDSKKSKLNIPSNTSFIIGSDDEEMSSDDEEDKSKPWCTYGANCYRKNPDHLKAYRHPGGSKAKQTKDKKDSDKKSAQKPKSPSNDKKKDTDDGDAKPTKTKDSSSSSSSSPPPPSSSSSDNPTNKMLDIKKNASSLNAEVENYKNVLRCALAKNKISVDEKRMLRTFRRNHDIDDQDHFRLLMQFGWSADEYDDGQKKDDDCDLDEERNILEKNGFAIISIKKGKTLTKAEDNVFSRVCAKFFQTMSKAQANYTIVEVGVIVNADLRKKYNLKLADFTQAGYGDVEWGFHGTTRDSIKVISETGFLHPDDLNKTKGGNKSKAKAKKGATSKITVLDDGFFGKGIYFSFYSDYAMFYSEERNSNQVLLSQVATGKTFKCSGRMDGKDCQKGYNSHYSPKGNEMVVFEPAQILPRYIVTFASSEAEEREQEG